MAQLTELKARRIAPGDKPLAHGGVEGLWLHSGAAKGQGKWIFRFVSPLTGKRRDMGLGPFPRVGIADARQRALEARRLIDSNKDPIDERDAARAASKAAAEAMNFERAAQRVHEERRPGWANPKHAEQWLTSLRDYAFPKIGKRKVSELSPGDFAEVLRPIWLTKCPGSAPLRQILD